LQQKQHYPESILEIPTMISEPSNPVVLMGAIWWGTRGKCPPHLFRLFLFRFCTWRGFKKL